MWINTNDHADTNDSDKQTVNRPVAVYGREILLNRLVACPHQDSHLHVIPGPDPGSTTNVALRDPGVRRDDEMRSPG